jgi:hypothetical protein
MTGTLTRSFLGRYSISSGWNETLEPNRSRISEQLFSKGNEHCWLAENGPRLWQKVKVAIVFSSDSMVYFLYHMEDTY